MFVVRSAASLSQPGHGRALTATSRTGSYVGGHRAFPLHPFPRRFARYSDHLRVSAGPSGKDSGSGDAEEDAPRLDIDQLAKQLSSEAARLRSTMDESSLDVEPDEDSYQEELPAATVEELEELRLQEAGDGGFAAYEFELFRPLGRIQVQQRTELGKASPVASTSYDEGPVRTATLVYTARYYSGMPYQDPVTVLIKEHLPECKAAAYAELQVMRQLLGGFPEDKWTAATRAVEDGPPIVQMLGYYLAEPTMTAAGLAAEEGQVASSENLWTVSKWESLRPLSLYHSAEQQEPFSLFGLAKAGASAAALRAKKEYLCALIRGCLEAVDFCHSRGVTHGSIGPGTVVVSTLDNLSADELKVKLDNFGLAKCSPPPVRGGSELIEGEYADCFAMGALLLETVFKVLGKSPDDIEEGFVQRLVSDVFNSDLGAFREYCEQEGRLTEAVDFLASNDSAGWSLLGGLLEGQRACALLDGELCDLLEASAD